MIVIKFGGHAMSDEHGSFAKAISEAIASGVSPVGKLLRLPESLQSLLEDLE